MEDFDADEEMIEGVGRFFLNTFGAVGGTGVDDLEFLFEGGAEALALFVAFS